MYFVLLILVSFSSKFNCVKCSSLEYDNHDDNAAMIIMLTATVIEMAVITHTVT